jgi:hypothetical protein
MTSCSPNQTGHRFIGNKFKSLMLYLLLSQIEETIGFFNRVLGLPGYFAHRAGFDRPNRRYIIVAFVGLDSQSH